MTKREFYERLRNGVVGFDELIDVISETEAWEYLSIRDRDEYEDKIWNEVREWWNYGTLKELGEYLTSLDFDKSYYLEEDGADEGPLSEDDIPHLIDKLEGMLEESDDWYDELPDGEESDDQENCLIEGIEELFGASSNN